MLICFFILSPLRYSSIYLGEMKGLFSGVYEMVFVFVNALSWLGFLKMGRSGAQVSINLFKNALLVVLTCNFSFGGALVGCVTGAITGQTTETGFLCGSGIGALSGAGVAIELLDSLLDGRRLNSKIALLYSLVINGEVFKECVSSAMLKAYQWQISMLDLYYGELSDIFDINENKGVSLELMKNIPVFNFCYEEMKDSSDEICCTICLENFKEGESARRLTNCTHIFHMACIDAWLVKHSTCPICRQDAWEAC